MFRVLFIYNGLVISFPSYTQKPLEAGGGQTLAALLRHRDKLASIYRICIASLKHFSRTEQMQMILYFWVMLSLEEHEAVCMCTCAHLSRSEYIVRKGSFISMSIFCVFLKWLVSHLSSNAAMIRHALHVSFCFPV